MRFKISQLGACHDHGSPSAFTDGTGSWQDGTLLLQLVNTLQQSTYHEDLDIDVVRGTDALLLAGD